MASGITIEDFLSNHSKDHSIDSIIIKWFKVNYGFNYQEKTVSEWESFVKGFFSETESSPKFEIVSEVIKPIKKDEKIEEKAV